MSHELPRTKERPGKTKWPVSRLLDIRLLPGLRICKWIST